MKKLVLLSLAAAFSVASFAQNARTAHPVNGVGNATSRATLYSNSLAKTTATDTIELSNFPDTTSIITYVADAATPFDSGYLYGTNLFGDQAWAERYDVSNTGTVKVLGMFARFNGNYSATSTKKVDMKVWSAGPRAPFGSLPKVYFSGFPNTVLASQQMNIQDLGIGLNGAGDTGAVAVFTAAPSINDSFFVGYSIAYDTTNFGGDTVGLYTTRDGLRFTNSIFLSGTDTIVNVQNAAMFDDGTWNDCNFGNFQQFLHFEMFPIVQFDNNFLSTGSISKNNLEFFGNFPNPASNSTNIKISLKKAADVIVTVMDMNGRVINTIQKNGLTTGQQIIPVSLANMSAGTYIYSVKTSLGDGMASQLIVK